MIKVPEALQKKYNLLLINSAIEPDQYGHCKKWLRYYLDFCKKYAHSYTDSKSLLPFLEKLKGKNQTLSQQSQAKKAVELYYSGIEKLKSISKNSVPLHEIHEDITLFDSKADNDPWVLAVDGIKNEIKLRHYSKKTLKAYSLWAEKLRYFTKSAVSF